MLMLFGSLSLFGFFIFLFWIIIAISTKEEKNIPIPGIVLSTVIFVIGVSLPTVASTSKDTLVNGNSEQIIILAAKSQNNELKNTIAKNISDTGNYSKESKKIEPTRSHLIVQAKAASISTSNVNIGIEIKQNNISNNPIVKDVAVKEIYSKPKDELQKKEIIEVENIISTINTFYSQVNNSSLEDSSNIDNKNNTTNDSIVDSNSGEQSNYKISVQQGLESVTAKVKIEADLHLLYDSERVIKDKTYYLYTLNTDKDTLDDFAYCVDVNSSELFKCSIDMILSALE